VISLCGNGGTVALIFLALPLNFESIQFVRPDSSGSNKYYSFPWDKCNDYLATFILPFPAAYRAAGDAKACMYTSIVSMWIFRIGFSYLVGKYMGLGVFGVWVAMVIDWVVRAICFVIRYFNGKWKHGAIV